MAYDESLAMRIRSIAENMDQPFVEKKMFGGLSFLYKGKMTVGIIKDQLCARIIESDFPNLFDDTNVTPMNFTGKIMKDFVYVSQDGLQSDEDIKIWIERGLNHARSKL